MTCLADADDDDNLLHSLTEDFMWPNNGADVEDDVLPASVPYSGADDKDDVLLASVPYTEELSAKSSNDVDQVPLSSARKPLRKPGTPTIKQETNDYDESTELLWKGHLTKFQLTTFKRFQLDAIHAVERKKDVIVVQKTGSGKSICFQLPSLFGKTKTMVVICSMLSLINS